MDAIDARLSALERDNRLEAAARLAEQSDRWARACALWERACSYDRAARAAIRAGQAEHAVRLAARSGSSDVIRAAARAASGSPDDARRAADGLASEGYHAAAAELRLALGDAAAAAETFEVAGKLRPAAHAYRLAGAPESACRCLRALIGRSPDHDGARIDLGSIYIEVGQPEQAVRVLQGVASDRPERQAALHLLVRAFTALGLTRVAEHVARDLTERGDVSSIAPARATVGDDAPVLFGRYVFEEEIARSATSRVLRARDRVRRQQVAVKLFFAMGLRDTGRDAWTRFEREARALSELEHPTIVPLIEYVASAPALVTEWMPGGSLADRLANETLAPDHAAEIVDAVLRALGEAHRRGILHRDVKPANVLFDAAGGARLVDFGSAHVNDQAVTVTEGVLGTLAYMAPEQRAGEPASFASDVYGAGAVFHHALTGAPPAARAPFLAQELTAEHRAIAERLVAPEPERPDSTEAARRLLGSIAWPSRRPALRAPHAQAPMPDGSRLATRDDDRAHDRWLERDVRVLDADPGQLALARAFARAGHRALATVLACSPGSSSLWVEHLESDRWDALDDRSQSELADALRALHRAGGCHGSIDADHVIAHHGSFLLAFPRRAKGGSPESDRRALDRLFAGRPLPGS